MNKIGQMYYSTGDYRRAVEFYQNSVKLNSEQKLEFVYANIASSYSKIGESDNAISYYLLADSVAPGNIFITGRLTDEYKNSGSGKSCNLLRVSHRQIK